MRAPHQMSLPASTPADPTFQTALGVVQRTKNMKTLAVHNEGHKLVVLEKSKLSNPKIYVVAVQDQGAQSTLHVVVGSDPRTRSAMLDATANKKAAGKYVDAVNSALASPVDPPSTPVPNHYMQKKTQVPWDDPNTEPDIDLGFSWLGLAGEIA